MIKTFLNKVDQFETPAVVLTVAGVALFPLRFAGMKAAA